MAFYKSACVALRLFEIAMHLAMHPTMHAVAIYTFLWLFENNV